MLPDYFVYDNIDYHDEISNELMEKMEKMKLRMLFTASYEAPTVEEREAAKAEYLAMVGKCRANTLVNMYD
jgi:hypothetical protein